MEKCVIFCAGGFNGLLEPVEDGYVIAADGGLTYVNQLGLTPDVVVWDFDSLNYIPTGAGAPAARKCGRWSGTVRPARA